MELLTLLYRLRDHIHEMIVFLKKQQPKDPIFEDPYAYHLMHA